MTVPIVFTWLRAVRHTKLSVGATALACLLVTYANADGSSCRPGDELLRNRLEVKKRALLNYRAELTRAGLLERTRAASPGRAAEWKLTLPGQQMQHHTPERVQHHAPGDPNGCISTTPTGASQRHQRVHAEVSLPPQDLPKTFGVAGFSQSPTGGKPHRLEIRNGKNERKRRQELGTKLLVQAVVRKLTEVTSSTISDGLALQTAALILSEASQPPDDPVRYVLTAIDREPDPKTRFLPITRPGYR